MKQQRMIARVIWFCYLFVIGIALPMMFAPDFPSYLRISDYLSLLSHIPFIRGLTLNYLIWITGFLLIIISAVRLLYKKKESYSLIYIAFVVLGCANYYRAVDISSQYHISKYLDKSIFQKTVITGTVVIDPDERENYTNLTIEPDGIIPDPDKTDSKFIELKGKTGYLLAKVFPSVGEIYPVLSYGDRVEVRTSIMLPKQLGNPGGFDYSRYLLARNIYATTMPVRDSDEIKIIGVGKVNPIVKFSLKAKQRLLKTLKVTMPLPEVAFLGGVSLGLRGGVPQKTKREFQSTGVAHVLAVSGLHVGFVYVLILMICSIFRIPKKIIWFILVAGLIVFAIITGASPATQRAVLMSCIGQFFYTFGGLGIKRSGQLTIPVAAFLILVFDPLKLPDGSFVLSVMAVWALVHLTNPIESFLRWNDFTKGLIFFPMFMILTSMTVISCLAILPEAISGLLSGIFPKWIPYFKTIPTMANFLPPWWALTAIIYSIGALIYFFYKSQNRDILEESFVLSPILKGLLIFTSAQLAIQIGMMLPLSAIYFQRFPIAGFYANFLAIPLIGFIVQLGLIAGLIDIFFSAICLPGVGMQIALYVNAFNWLLSKGFLSLAENWGNYIYYPYVSTITTFQIVLYYSGVLFIAWYDVIIKFFKNMYGFVAGVNKKIFIAISVCGIVLVAVGFLLKMSKTSEKKLTVTVLDAGFGSSVIVQTPAGKKFLIDGGWGARGGWDFGESGIAVTLSKYQIKELDGIIITNPYPSNLGGLTYALKHFKVKNVYTSLNLDWDKTTAYPEFLNELGDKRYLKKPYSPEPVEIYLNWYDLRNAVNCEVKRVKEGDVIYKEPEMEIKVLAPGDRKITGSEDDTGNNSMVLAVRHGSVKFLLPSGITQEGEYRLIDRYGHQLKSNILLIPKYGHPRGSTVEFIKAVSPEVAICQYGFLSSALRDRISYYFYDSTLKYTLYRYLDFEELTQEYRTDRSGAVVIVSDGVKYSVNTILDESGFGLRKLVPQKEEESIEITLDPVPQKTEEKSIEVMFE